MAAVEGGTRETMSLSPLSVFRVLSTDGGHVPGPGIKRFRLKDRQSNTHTSHTHTHTHTLGYMGVYLLIMQCRIVTLMYKIIFCKLYYNVYYKLYLLCDNVSVFSV